MRKFLDTILILCLVSLSFTPEESAARGTTNGVERVEFRLRNYQDVMIGARQTNRQYNGFLRNVSNRELIHNYASGYLIFEPSESDTVTVDSETISGAKALQLQPLLVSTSSTQSVGQHRDRLYGGVGFRVRTVNNNTEHEQLYATATRSSTISNYVLSTQNVRDTRNRALSHRSVYQPARGGTTDQCNDGEVDYVTYDSPNLRIPPGDSGVQGMGSPSDDSTSWNDFWRFQLIICNSNDVTILSKYVELQIYSDYSFDCSIRSSDNNRCNDHEYAFTFNNSLTRNLKIRIQSTSDEINLSFSLAGDRYITREQETFRFTLNLAVTAPSDSPSINGLQTNGNGQVVFDVRTFVVADSQTRSPRTVVGTQDRTCAPGDTVADIDSTATPFSNNGLDFRFTEDNEDSGLPQDDHGIEICFDSEQEPTEYFDLVLHDASIQYLNFSISGSVVNTSEVALNEGNKDFWLNYYNITYSTDRVEVEVNDIAIDPITETNDLIGTNQIGFPTVDAIVLEGSPVIIPIFSGDFTGEALLSVVSEDIGCSPGTEFRFGAFENTQACATTEDDYTPLNETVTLSARGSTNIVFNTRDDDIREGFEIVRLVIRRPEESVTDIPFDASLPEGRRSIIIKIGDTDASLGFTETTFDVSESEGVANIIMRLSNPIGYANAVSVPFITVDNFGSAVGGTSCDTDVDYIISLPDNPVISAVGGSNNLGDIQSSGGIIICDDDDVELATENFAVIASDSAIGFNVPTDIENNLLGQRVIINILGSDSADITFEITNGSRNNNLVRINESNNLQGNTLDIEITLSRQSPIPASADLFIRLDLHGGPGRNASVNDFIDDGNWADSGSTDFCPIPEGSATPVCFYVLPSILPRTDNNTEDTFDLQIPFNNDTIIEGDETFILTIELSASVPGVEVERTRVEVTIADQDIAFVTFSQTEYLIEEGDLLSLPIFLRAGSDDPNQPFEINPALFLTDIFTIRINTQDDSAASSPATPNEDYTRLINIQRTFTSTVGEILSIEIDDDRLIENNETFEALIEVVPNREGVRFFANLSATSSRTTALITIIDNDTVSIGFEFSQLDVTEGEGIARGQNEYLHSINILLQQPTIISQNINLAIRPVNNILLDTATLFDPEFQPTQAQPTQAYDYRLLTETATFPSGTQGDTAAAQIEVSFAIVDDSLIEGETQEAFRLQIGLMNAFPSISLNPAESTSPSILSVNIRDNDRAQVRLDDIPPSISEDTPITFNVILEALGSAGLPDRSRDIELLETVSLLAAIRTEDLTAEDDDFQNLEPVEVIFNPGTRTTNGRTRQTVTFFLNDDEVFEGDETFDIILSPSLDINEEPIPLPSGVTLFNARDNVVIIPGLITDDDTDLVSFQLEISGNDLSTRDNGDIPIIDVPEESGTLSMRVNFFNETTQALITQEEIQELFVEEVSITLIVRIGTYSRQIIDAPSLPSDVADLPSITDADFRVLSPQQITFDEQTLTAEIEVEIINDNIVEGQERLDVWLELIYRPAGINFSDQRHALIIEDDSADQSTLYFFTLNRQEINSRQYEDFCGRKTNNQVQEIEGEIRVVVCLTNPLSQDLSVQVATPAPFQDTAIGETDYEIVSRRLNFFACSLEERCIAQQSFTLSIVDDRILENDEIFTLGLQALDAQGRIINDPEDYPEGLSRPQATQEVRIIENELLLWEITGDSVVQEREEAVYTISYSGRSQLSEEARVSIEVSLAFTQMAATIDIAEIEDLGDDSDYYLFREMRRSATEINTLERRNGYQGPDPIQVERLGDSLVRLSFLFIPQENLPSRLRFALQIRGEGLLEGEEQYTVLLSSPGILFTNRPAARQSQPPPGGQISVGSVTTIIRQDESSSVRGLTDLVTPVLLRATAPYVSRTLSQQVTRTLYQQIPSPLRLSRQSLAINFSQFYDTPARYLAPEDLERAQTLYDQHPFGIDSLRDPANFPNWNIWTAIDYRQIETGINASIETSVINALLGSDYRLSNNVLLGVFIHYDQSESDVTLTNAEMTFNHTGFGAGLYGGVSFFDGKMITDLSLSWSSLAYEGVSGEERGDFGAQRTMASWNLSGTIEQGDFRIHPLLSTIWAREVHEGYTDNQNRRIPQKEYMFLQVSFGPRVGYFYSLGVDQWIEPYVEVLGSYDLSDDLSKVLNERDGTTIASYAFRREMDFSGSAKLGFEVKYAKFTLNLSGEFDDYVNFRDYISFGGGGSFGYKWSHGNELRVSSRYDGQEYMIENEWRTAFNTGLALSLAQRYKSLNGYEADQSIAYLWDEGLSLDVTSHYKEQKTASERAFGFKTTLGWRF